MQTLDAAGVRCHVLIDGWRTVSPRFVFRGYTDDLQGPFVRPFLDADGKLQGRLAALLIESRDGVVLVDAGMGRFNGELDAGHVHERLAELGVRPWDVRCVVITHGHADHVGGLIGPRNEPAFPDARHVISRVEAEYWASPDAAALPDGASLAATTALTSLVEAGALDTVEAGAKAAGDVQVIEAPGHTAGHLAVVVNDAVLWAGDSLVSQLNVAHPEWTSAADMDGPTNEDTRRALLGRAADDDLLLAGSHLPVTGRVRRAADGFALEED